MSSKYRSPAVRRRRSTIRHSESLPPRARRRTSSQRRCGATGKVRYRDHREARDVLHSAQASRALHGERSARREIRAYDCYRCHGVHLTSQEAHSDRTSRFDDRNDSFGRSA